MTLGVALAVGASTCAPTAVAAPLPWAPLPVNECGETGFDPALREPDPNAPAPPLLPQLPDRIDIPLPYPEIVPVPVPGPEPDNTRIATEPLPDDPCADPCPEIRVTTDAEPAAPGSSGSAGSSGSSSGSAGRSGSAGSSESSSGSAGSSDLGLPEIHINPESEPIPIPIPGDGPGPDPQPGPTPVDPGVDAGPAASAVSTPVVGDVDLIEQVTGHGSPNRTDVRWAVHGTDLGIVWESRPGEVVVAFGDTFGDGWVPGGAGAETADWRSNVVGHSTDRDLSDGMRLDSMVADSPCHAAEVIDSRKIRNYETTTIPTSGFAIGGRQYLSYMSVARWSRIPGQWWTNYGGIAWSDDGGSTWIKSQHAQWDNLFGLAQFQVTAMVPHGDHVYMFGTPNGRIGMVGLARVPVDQLLNKTAYQYWVDGSWRPAAQMLLGANTATPILSGMASELSVRYDDARGLWQMSYLDVSRGAIVLRTAASPQGVWSDVATLVETATYPQAYGGFMHPWSGGSDLYFLISAWNSYNVYLMRARLG